LKFRYTNQIASVLVIHSNTSISPRDDDVVFSNPNPVIANVAIAE
jgi:hypothetical protein